MSFLKSKPLRGAKENTKAILLLPHKEESYQGITMPFTQICEVFGLSKREAIISFYVLRGYYTKEIGNILHLSPRTIEDYLEKIKNKYSVSSKSNLVKHLFSIGFVYVRFEDK